MKQIKLAQVKQWFYNKELKEKIDADYNLVLHLDADVERETEKAIYITLFKKELGFWIPKSCLQTKTDNGLYVSQEYHEYLVETCRKAYREDKLYEKHTITSGRNKYDGDAFLHQKPTKELSGLLEKYNVEYLTKEEFKKTI